MSRIVQHKTSFTGGELGPELYGRDDLRAYDNGAARLRNVLVRPTGGVTRRPGLRHVAELPPGPGRLIPFDFNAQQIYLVLLTPGEIRVYFPGEAVPDATLASPFMAEHLPGLDWTQSADTLLLVHPDVPPQRLLRHAPQDWRLDGLPFAQDTSAAGHTLKRLPFAKFGVPQLRMGATGTTGTVTLQTTNDLFVPGHVGTYFEIKGRQVVVTAVVNPQNATAETREDLVDTELTGDWGEEAVSHLRGWPRSIVFHKDRLILGGTRDLPNHVFMSRAGGLYDFDTDEGQDDAAIDFPLMSDQVNAICSVSSARHLQVFTSGGEWIVEGEPLTPSSVEARPQTAIGSMTHRTVRPHVVDGTTIFVGPGGEGLYEFIYTDLEQAYSAVDLTLLARHLAPKIADLAYDRFQRLLYAVTEEGALACLTQYRAEQVTAWTLCASAGGAIRAVAVVRDVAYVLAERAGQHFLEELDPAVQQDASLLGESASPATVWTGLDHLEGQEVSILADDCPRGRATVAGGAVTLDRPASRVAVGLPFRHEIAPLPPVVRNNTGRDPAAAVRLIETTLRLRETAQLRIDLGRGPEEVPLGGFSDPLLDTPPVRFSGDRRVRSAGWRRADIAPLWSLEGDEPLPLTLLSVTNELKVND
jgi:hypothetical protein